MVNKIIEISILFWRFFGKQVGIGYPVIDYEDEKYSLIGDTRGP